MAMENHLRVIVLCCLFCSLTVQVAGSKGNFILIAPKVIDAGSTAYFTLTLFDVPQGGTITLKLTEKVSNVSIAESQVSVNNNHNLWIEMSVPPLSSEVSATLYVVGSFTSGYHIEEFKDLRICPKPILTIIQTDKPLYKPGQTIKFRVLPMDNQLKPLDPNTTGDIRIEDPSGVRVAQWKEVQFTEGIMQFELPLSDEPPLGKWHIYAFINQVSTIQSFKVEKYVLPKFDVTIKPPTVIMADAEIIPIEVCAKYTYGKFVEGSVKVKVTYQNSFILDFYRHKDSFIPYVETQAYLHGCHTFQVNIHDLLLQLEFLYGTDLEVFAEVSENVTGIVMNATTSLKTSDQKLILEFVRESNHYKPTLPYIGLLRVKNPDGTPAMSEEIQICVTMKGKRCLIFTSDTNGMIRFSIKPSPEVQDIRIEAAALNYDDVKYSPSYENLKLRKPTSSMNLRPWYSLSGSYLQIPPITEEMECEKTFKVTVLFSGETGSTINFFHQVLSKGRIVQQGSHQQTFNSKVKHIEYDFEEQILSNGNQSLNFSKTEIGEFTLTFDTSFTMSPMSRLLIFYVRDDKEVVADTRKFHIKKCLQNKVSLHFQHEQQYPNTEAAMLLSASPSSLCGIHMVDKSIRLLEGDETFSTEKLFNIMGSYNARRYSSENHGICVDDSIEEKKEIRRYIRYVMRNGKLYVDSQQAFEETGMIVITDLKLKSFSCTYYPRTFDSPRRRKMSRKKLRTNIKPASPPLSSDEIRSYFPETWLWELHSVDSTGEIAIKRQLPHTITEWVGGAICVHPKMGLGIWDTSSITTFQPFFIDFQLPYSVVRGESFVIPVIVFNYLSDCLPIKLSLEPSDDYTLLTELRFQKICVCGGQSSSVRFSIRPTKLGMVNITVYAYAIEQDQGVCENEITAHLTARDAITKGILVEAEGCPKEDVFNYLICPENTNGSFASEIPLLLPDDVILDSARAFMTITGDVMGPAIKGLKKLVRQPCGCGEQNMILFVPNIFVLDYLTSIEKLTEDIKEECLRNMKRGYQRELRYKHSDGSYSAFGSRDKEGSLWLTAFVLRSFGQARRFMSIDERDLNNTRSWILKRQSANGCFMLSGIVLHKEMTGGLSGGEESLAPLTAYVLISLLELSTEKLDSDVVKRALKCLESEKQPDIYVLSLFAYASALAKENATYAKYVHELDKRAITKDNLKYWEPSSKSKSVAVEIASYYLLARFEMERSKAIKYSLPVVRWITYQRNSDGGFISTQDTVVALQALATYASYMSKSPVDITLSVETDDVAHSFKVDESNKLVTQELKIADVPTIVDIAAYGDGCAGAQFSLRYNVEKVTNTGGLTLSVNARERNDCNLPSLGVCMRYVVHKESTNMAVLFVKLPSGFVADEESLLLLENDSKVQLMRHEIDENIVNLYFKEITNDEKCFEFHVKSEFEVENIKPSIIRLYDYYQPDRQVTKEYSIPSICNTTALPDIP